MKDRPYFTSYLRCLFKLLFKRKSDKVIVSNTGDKYVDVSSLPWIMFRLIYFITIIVLNSKYPLSLYGALLAGLIYFLLCPLRYFLTDFERIGEENEHRPVKKYSVIQRLLILLEVLILVTVIATSIVYEPEQEVYADTVVSVDKNVSTTMEAYEIASEYMEEHYRQTKLISYGLELHDGLDSEPICNFRFKGDDGCLLLRKCWHSCDVSVDIGQHQMIITTWEYRDHKGEKRRLMHSPVEIDVQRIMNVIENDTSVSSAQIVAKVSEVHVDISSHFLLRDYKSNVDPGGDTWLVRIWMGRVFEYVVNIAEEKVTEIDW